MKYFTLCIFLLISISSSLFSQEDMAEEKSLELSVSAGVPVSYLPKEFMDGWKGGRNFGMGLGVAYPAGDLGYSAIYISIENNNFSYDSSGLATWKAEEGIGLSSNNNDVNVTTAFVDYKGTFSTSKTGIAPYFLLGVGFQAIGNNSGYIIDSLGQPINNFSSSIGFGWRAGAGLDVSFTEGWGFFGEAKFNVAIDKFQYFTFGGGLRWKL